MGEVTDIEGLLGKHYHEKRIKLAWSICTVLGTVLCTTATVSWTLRGYVDDMQHANKELHGEILVLAKKVEDLEVQQREVTIVRETANKALFLAQLAHAGKP